MLRGVNRKSHSNFRHAEPPCWATDLGMELERRIYSARSLPGWMDRWMGGSEDGVGRKEKKQGDREREREGGNIFLSLSCSFFPLLSFFPSFCIKHEHYRWSWKSPVPLPSFISLFSLSPRDNSCHDPACGHCFILLHTPHIVLLLCSLSDLV